MLPDHLHAVWTLPPDDADFSTRWRLIKTRFAKALPDRERRSAVRAARAERGIWPHSSFHRDERRGLFPLDWGGEAAMKGEFGECR